MLYFGNENFEILLFQKYDIQVNEEQIKEEAQLLYKNELDENIVTNKLRSVATDLVLFETCTCIINKIEWIVCVASDADTNYPLFLICLKDGIKVYEEILKEE